MFLGVPRASGPFITFGAPKLIFGGTEGVASCFHVLRARTRFRRYRGRRVPFSCFMVPDSFSAITMASGPVFMFCVPGIIFGDAEGVGTRFYVFALPDSFSAVSSASGPVFIFCGPVLVFVGTERVGSRFHVLRSLTRFRRYRGLQVSFSCFALPDSFSAVPRSCEPVFMFSATGHVFGDTEGVGSLFHILRPRTHFRR
jgi:hypothetical protein